MTANNLSPLKQEDSVLFMCESKSPGLTYWWFINTWFIQPNVRLKLSLDNMTVTTFHVITKDIGHYECETSNPMCVHHSDPFILTILCNSYPT